MSEFEFLSTPELIDKLRQIYDFGIVALVKKVNPKEIDRYIEHWGGDVQSLGACEILSFHLEADNARRALDPDIPSGGGAIHEQTLVLHAELMKRYDFGVVSMVCETPFGYELKRFVTYWGGIAPAMGLARAATMRTETDVFKTFFNGGKPRPPIGGDGDDTAAGDLYKDV